MVEREIIWSKKAIHQLEEILTYYQIRNGNKIYSRKLYGRIIKSTKTLSLQPQLGKKTEFEKIRVLLIGVYLIIYEISNTNVEILTIRDGRRNPEEFNKLLKN